MGKIVLSVIASILILGILGSAYALNPVFLGDSVVQTGDTIGGKTLSVFGFSPQINDNGDVAFAGFFYGGSGIFTQNSLLVEEGSIISGRTLTGFGNPRINNNGDVAFIGFFSGGNGVFTPNSFLAGTGSIIGGKTLTGFVDNPSINDNGDVVFRGFFSGGSGIFTQNSLLVKTGDTVGGKTLTFVSVPSINDNGDVAFFGIFSGGSGIFTQNSLLVEEGSIIGGRTLINFLRSPSINDNGDVAFLATFSGGSGIFTQNSLLVEEGSIISGRTLTDFVNISIDDNGDVAFRGTFSGGEGIFTQNNVVAETGSIVGGKTLTSFIDSFPSKSDNGNVAFRGFFSGGSGIFTQNSLLVETGPPNVSSINPRIVDAFGNPLHSISVGQQVQITADLENQNNFEQSFVYYVKVRETGHEAWISGTLDAGQSFSPALSWTPNAAGTYTIDITIFDDIDRRNVLAPTLTISQVVVGSGDGTILDTIPPQILQPKDIVVGASDSNGAIVTYEVLAIDNEDGIVKPSCSPSSGSLFPIGDTQVVCSAFDSSGNAAPQKSFLITVNSPSLLIPNWIKEVAAFWCDDKIDDASFIEGIQYLIDNGIIIVQATTSGSGGTQEIPSWVKNNACWWSQGLISDEDFASGLKYLIENGIIKI